MMDRSGFEFSDTFGISRDPCHAEAVLYQAELPAHNTIDM